MEIDPNARVSARILSEIFGVSPSRVAQFHREGMPKAARGLFCLSECVQWNIARWQTAQGNNKSQDEQRTALLLEQTIKTNLENQVTLSKLFDADEVQGALDAVITLIVGQLDGLPPRVCNRLAGLHDAGEIKAELSDECREIRDTLSEAFSEMGGYIRSDRPPGKTPPAKKGRSVGRSGKSATTRKPRARKVAKQ